MFDPEALTAFIEVVVINVVLSGDNAVVIGLAASGLPQTHRNRAIAVGIIAATVLRIVFATIAVNLMQIPGLVLAGGVLLLWVCWKMWRELSESRAAAKRPHRPGGSDDVPHKTLAQAATQIVIADVSMSLDNVLAVAGAARTHPWILAFGLVLSICLMGLAASLIARLLDRWRWIAYVGLALVFYVALQMIVTGSLEVRPLITG